jgi:type IV secretory pathway TrbD component
MILVVILFIVVSLLPVDVWAGHYIPLHKFPHGVVLLRGLLAGVLYFAIQSYCSST